MQKVKSAFFKIMESSVFRTDGEPIDLVESLQTLADAIIDPINGNESMWDLGEGLDCTLGSLIIGAYWAMTDWHDGKEGYRLLSSLGSIYTPNMAQGPEPESDEETAYDMINEAMGELDAHE